MGFGGLVLPNVVRTLQVLLGEDGMSGGDLDADRLALEQRLRRLNCLLGLRLLAYQIIGLPRSRHLGEWRILRYKITIWRVCVGACEVNDLLAFVGDAHAGHDGIVFLRLKSGDDPVPVLGHNLALYFDAAAKFVGEINVEAFELAARTCEIPRGISAFRRD